MDGSVVFAMWRQCSPPRLTPFSLKTDRCASEPVVLSLLRSKCMTILLYAVEALPLLDGQIQSIEFTLTRIFIKLFRTGSPNTDNACRVNFGFPPAKYQIFIRTAC